MDLSKLLIIPLIVSKTGVLSNYFIDEYNSCVVEPNNYLQISSSILKIIKDLKIRKITDHADEYKNNLNNLRTKINLVDVSITVTELSINTQRYI